MEWRQSACLSATHKVLDKARRVRWLHHPALRAALGLSRATVHPSSLGHLTNHLIIDRFLGGVCSQKRVCQCSQQSVGDHLEWIVPVVLRTTLSSRARTELCPTLCTAHYSHTGKRAANEHRQNATHRIPQQQCGTAHKPPPAPGSLVKVSRPLQLMSCSSVKNLRE